MDCTCTPFFFKLKNPKSFIKKKLTNHWEKKKKDKHVRKEKIKIKIPKKKKKKKEEMTEKFKTYEH